MVIGLALSGGGFRATLYHLGVVRYLRDANLLDSVSHITSVSGGSVLAAHLTLNWDRYCGDADDFEAASQEILDFVRLDVRNRILRRYPFAAGSDLLRRCTPGKRRRRSLTRTVLLEKHYEQYLFGDTCLYELPRSPELHILSTNLSGGGLSSFTRDGLLMERRSSSGGSVMEPHHVGLATVPMAVAASSAFPGFFPPLEMSAEMVGAEGGKFQTQYFTDGGVYDNLGVRMFHHIAKRSNNSLHQADFADVSAAMRAWNHVARHEDATPLGRLAEIFAERTGCSQVSILEEPTKFVNGLHELISGGELRRDHSLQTLMQRSTGVGSDSVANSGHRGSPLDNVDEAKEVAWGEALGQPSDPENQPYEDRLMRNLRVLRDAFQEIAGKDVLQVKNQPFDAILASDAGKKIQVSGNERIGGLLGTAMRSSDILMDRVWQLEQEHFKNAQGVIFLPINRIVLPEEDPTALHPEVQFQVSHIRTDMDRFSGREVSGLVRHGYAVARQSLLLHSNLVDTDQPDLPVWDPASHPNNKQTRLENPTSRRGALAISPTVEARKLQSSASRKYLSLLSGHRDWISYLYIPILVLLFGVIPWQGWQYVNHLRMNAMLSGAITQSRQDYNHLLAMLEHGPVAPWEPVDFVIADQPSPLFAERGLDMICDARITDLRNWNPDAVSNTGPGAENFVYVCRHVSLRKNEHFEGSTALQMQSLWDYPDVLIRCSNPEFNPVLRRCNLASDGKEGPYRWEVQLDFSNLAVGETAHLMVEAIVRQNSDPKEFRRREWWRYEVDGEPEKATSWVLLPTSNSYSDIEVVKYDQSTNDPVTIVEPTRMSVIRHGTILNWSVVHPAAEKTYSFRWKQDR